MNMYDHALDFKKKLEKQDKRILWLVAFEYNRTLHRLRAEFEKLANIVVESPEPPTKYQLNTMQSVQNAINDIQERMEELHVKVEETIVKSEEIITEQVTQQMQETFEELHEMTGSEDIQFNKVNTDAFEEMIGNTAEGTPLRKILEEHSPYSEKEAIINVLRDGAMQGKNPVQIANDMVKLGYQDKRHALLVARTECMRVAHDVGLANMKENGVTKVQWVAGETTATCMACWAMSGKVFDIDNVPYDHPNGRCVLNPYFEDLAEANPNLYAHDPEENMRKLSEEEQKAILGQKRWELWKQGLIKLEDMAYIKPNETWGDQVALKNLEELGVHEDKMI